MFEVITMRYADIHTLLENNSQAQAYFASLSSEVQEALLAHGDGVNTLEELKRFSKVVQEKR